MSTGDTKIADYGLIGNCRTAALVSRGGSIDWCCFPRFDSPSFFARILDSDVGGHFVIQPAQSFDSSQRYEDETNVLVTTFISKSGEASLSDCLSVSGDAGEIAPQHEILRIARGISGRTLFKLMLKPRADYGSRGVQIKRRGNWGLEFCQGHKMLLLQSDLPISIFKINHEAEAATAEFSIQAGQAVAFSLIYSDTAPAPLPLMGSAALERESATASYWRDWIRKCSYQGEYLQEVRRSALALKLLAFAPSGAIIAAPTTSIPEWPGGERNWDYRFCWLRDAAFTIRSFSRLGYFEEANAYLDWLLHATRLTHPKLQVVYSVYGHARLHEKKLAFLKGYRGSQPVRIGNGAWNQRQLDIYGEVLDAAHSSLPHDCPVDQDTKKFLLGLGKAVIEFWSEPDDGIWEARSGQAYHTHSNVMAWVALDRLQSLARRHGWALPKNLLIAKNAIRSAIERYGYSPQLGRYTKTFGGSDLDSSLLLMSLVGYTSPDSPRFSSTVRAIQKELSKNGLVYRYRPGTDGMPSNEGAFVICNFWLAESLAKGGMMREANQALRAVLDRMNGPKLLPEEIDPDSGEYLGNYPQAFSHIGLINAALTIHECERDRGAA